MAENKTKPNGASVEDYLAGRGSEQQRADCRELPCEEPMAAKVNWKALVVAILGAIVFGISVGLGIGFAARALGWPTGFVGPLTAGLVSALLLAFYARRSKRDRGSADGRSA